MKKQYRLVSSFEMDAFAAIVSHLRCCATHAYLIRPHSPASPNAQLIRDALDLHPAETDVRKWPGTELLWETASRLEFSPASEILDLIGREFSSFSQLAWPHFFEDLHVTLDGELLFYSISHEIDFIMPDNQSNADFLRSTSKWWECEVII